MSGTAPETAKSVGVPARAKLNLYLHLIGRRADGYHLLESLVAFTQMGDLLRAQPAEEFALALDGPFAAALGATPADDNLVLRAARALAAWASAAGSPVGAAQIALTKRLPVASGIGGGSADAAAALLALKALWALPIGEAALAGLAQGLGADVPACLAGAPALMEGIGERVTPIAPLPPVPLLLINPGLPLSTPAVYRAFRDQGEIKTEPRPKPVGPWRDGAALIAALAPTANDLEPAARALCPAVDAVLAALRAEGALFARMSGSGATCFGFFARDEAAVRAAARLRSAEPLWWIEATALDGGRS